MKKSTFIISLLIIFALMAGTVSAYFFVRSRASDTYQNQEQNQEQEQKQEQTENQAAEALADESAPRELESMIYFNDMLYSLKQVEKYSGLAEEPHKLYGVIEGSVSRYEKPTQNLTTNDEILAGKEVYQFRNEIYSDAILVYIDKERWIYAPYEEVPEELKTYSFRDEQELVDFAINRMEEAGYSLSSSDGSNLIQLNSLPEEFKRIDGVFEKALDYSTSPRYVQMWYCEQPYRLLVLMQEGEEVITPVLYGTLTYIDRLRSQLSPEYAWVVTQAHYTAYQDRAFITADLFSADTITDGYGEKILSELTEPTG